MATQIDELVIALGFDASKVDAVINNIGGVLNEVNNTVKEFGTGLADGFSGAEAGSEQTSAALAGVKANAQEAGQELQKVGTVGAAATAKVESGAKKAGRQVGFLGRQASAAGKKIASISKAAITGFAAGLAAPLLGALALNTVVKDYTEGLKRLEELNKKRNLSLKERQERQELLNKYTEKDIKLYRESSKTFEEVGKVLEGLGREIMRALLPAFAALARGLMTVIKWVAENARHWKVLIPILAVAAVAALKALATLLVTTVIPAVWSFTTAILANPVTWLILLLAGLGILLEDMIVWLQGGESAFGDLWNTIASGGDYIYDAVQAIKKFFSDIGQSWGDIIADFILGNATIQGVLDVISSLLSGLAALLTGDIDGAFKQFENAGQAAANLINDAFTGLLGLFEQIYDWVANKISGALDTVKEKAKGALDIISTPGNKLADMVFGSEADNLASINAQLAQAQEQARLAQSGAAAAGNAGPTSIDSSVNTTIGGVTQNITTTDPIAAGNASAAELRKLASNSNHGVKSGS